MARSQFSNLALTALAALASCGGGGGSSASKSGVAANLSTVLAQPAFGVLADGVDPVTITVTVLNGKGQPMADRTVVIAATGTGNLISGPAQTDANGIAIATVRTSTAETKTVSVLVDPGPNSIQLSATDQTTFVPFDAKARFVRTDGSDANDGLSPARAWASVSHAVGQLAPGETAYIGAGTYSGTVVIKTSGLPGEPITLRGDTTGLYTGVPGEVIVDAQGALSGIHLSSASEVVIDRFTIIGSVSPSAPGAAIHLSGSCSEITIRKTSIHSNDRGILAIASDGIRIESNVIHANLDDAVTLRNSDDCQIRNNLIYANTGIGILVQAGSQSAKIKSNTLYANGSDQLHLDAGSNSATIRNNIISQGLDDGIEVQFPSSCVSDHNLLWNHLGLNLNGPPAGVGDVTGDPGFASPAGPDNVLGGSGWKDDNFRLTIGSPAVDAGSVPAGVVLMSTGGSLGTMTTRTDGLSDGTSPDGAVLNLGFHYPAPPSIGQSEEEGSGGGSKTGTRITEGSTSSLLETNDTFQAQRRFLGNRRASGASSWTAASRMRAGSRGPLGAPGPT